MRHKCNIYPPKVKKEKRKNTPFFIPVFFLFPGKGLERDGENFLSTRPRILIQHCIGHDKCTIFNDALSFIYFLWWWNSRRSRWTRQTDMERKDTVTVAIQIHHFCISCCKDRSQSDLGKTLVNILFAPVFAIPFVNAFCKIYMFGLDVWKLASRSIRGGKSEFRFLLQFYTLGRQKDFVFLLTICNVDKDTVCWCSWIFNRILLYYY